MENYQKNCAEVKSAKNNKVFKILEKTQKPADPLEG